MKTCRGSGVFGLAPPALDRGHLEGGEDAEAGGEFPVVGELENHAPDLGGEVAPGFGAQCGGGAGLGADLHVVAELEEVGLVFDDAEELVEAVPLDNALGVRALVVVPEDGGHHPDPTPLAVQLAHLSFRDGVLPHLRAHAGYHQDSLGGVPTAQDFQQQRVGYPTHHLREGVGVDGCQDEQVGPLDQLRGLLQAGLDLCGGVGVVADDALPQRLVLECYYLLGQPVGHLVDDGAGGDLRLLGEADGDGLGEGHVSRAIGGDEKVQRPRALCLVERRDRRCSACA